MAISGYLADFSLAELFLFLDQGQKTGLLTLNLQRKNLQPYYIWSHQGRIVAAANRLDGLGLTSLMCKRNLIENSDQIKDEDITRPLGLSLKSKSIVNAEELKMLFGIQVMRTVCTLFTIPNAYFEFAQAKNIPLLEMTGLSAPATEITLAGLRALKDWSALKEKLPEPTSSLMKTIEGEPHLRLNHTESKVWELVDGRLTIEKMAPRLDLSIEELQKTAFRIILIGIAEEIPLADSIDSDNLSTEDVSESLNQSFLEDLVDFLDNV